MFKLNLSEKCVSGSSYNSSHFATYFCCSVTIMMSKMSEKSGVGRLMCVGAQRLRECLVNAGRERLPVTKLSAPRNR